MILRKIHIRLACSFSALVLAVIASAGPFQNLSGRIRSLDAPDRIIAAVAHDPAAMRDPDIRDAIKKSGFAHLTPPRKKELAEAVREMVGLRAMQDSAEGDGNAQAEAKSIKSSFFYRDAGTEEQSSWLGKALARLKNFRFRPRETPNIPSGGGAFLGRLIVPVLWVLLAGAVLLLAYLALRHVDWRRQRTRKAKSVLDDDEPERTVDEWLENADRLAAQGHYREAVRAIYLASLLRFDEFRVARFDRRQTNWEHLQRIGASPRKPPTLDFLPPTKAFDRIWYGGAASDMSDVDRFRRWYTDALEQLRSARP